MNLLPIAPLAILMAGVLLQLVLGRAINNKAKGWLAFLCGLGALGCLLAMLPAVASGTALDAVSIAWDTAGKVTAQLHVDGLGLLFALMATGIGSAILLYCIDYMAHEPFGTTRFYALMLTFIAGLVGLVTSANLLVAYLFWEVIGLCSYFLVGFWYQETAAAQGARKVLLMTHLPGYALLLGILLLYHNSGTFLWTDPALAAHFTTGIFLLMLVAAMAKSVMFPLHTWIPEAMNAPTPVSALLHSACYVKAGLYLLARFYSLNGNSPWPVGWSTLVIIIGCLTMLTGALFALAQTDLKRLLAYSTISQLGYIIVAIGLGTPAALLAGLFYTFSHGLFKGTLFLCAGAVQHAAGTRDMRKLGGLASRMPGVTRAWLIAAAAIIGVPLTNGFVAKWLLFDATLGAGAGGWVVLVVAWLVSILTAFYILKATVSVFYGDVPDDLAARKPADAPIGMQVGMGVMAGLCLLFGLAPQILTTWVVLPAARGLGFSPTWIVSWLGFHATSPASFLAIGIILLALLLAGLVFALTRARPSSTARTVSIFTGGDPLPEPDNAGAEDFSDLAQTVIRPAYTVLNPDPVYGAVYHAVQYVAAQTGRLFGWLEKRPVVSILLLAVVLLAAAWIL
jgi:NADH:ubiquinone oxidoreductase subunit 5 (subunit L)/multisubunit Na+/H+ antiporter MnhA subunit